MDYEKEVTLKPKNHTQDNIILKHGIFLLSKNHIGYKKSQLCVESCDNIAKKKKTPSAVLIVTREAVILTCFENKSVLKLNNDILNSYVIYHLNNTDKLVIDNDIFVSIEIKNISKDNLNIYDVCTQVIEDTSNIEEKNKPNSPIILDDDDSTDIEEYLPITDVHKVDSKKVKTFENKASVFETCTEEIITILNEKRDETIKSRPTCSIINDDETQLIQPNQSDKYDLDIFKNQSKNLTVGSIANITTTSTNNLKCTPNFKNILLCDQHSEIISNNVKLKQDNVNLSVTKLGEQDRGKENLNQHVFLTPTSRAKRKFYCNNKKNSDLNSGDRNEFDEDEIPSSVTKKPKHNAIKHVELTPTQQMEILHPDHSFVKQSKNGIMNFNVIDKLNCNEAKHEELTLTQKMEEMHKDDEPVKQNENKITDLKPGKLEFDVGDNHLSLTQQMEIIHLTQVDQVDHDNLPLTQQMEVIHSTQVDSDNLTLTQQLEIIHSTQVDHNNLPLTQQKKVIPSIQPQSIESDSDSESLNIKHFKTPEKLNFAFDSLPSPSSQEIREFCNKEIPIVISETDSSSSEEVDSDGPPIVHKPVPKRKYNKKNAKEKVAVKDETNTVKVGKQKNVPEKIEHNIKKQNMELRQQFQENYISFPSTSCYVQIKKSDQIMLNESKRPNTNTSVVVTRNKALSLNNGDSSKNHPKRYEVMFTQLNDAKLHEAVKKLGGQVKENHGDVLVAGKLCRTWKFMYCLSLDIPIVSSKWLIDGLKHNYFLDPYKYILTDKAAEKRYNINLKKILEEKKKQKYLSGWTICVMPDVIPVPKLMKQLIEINGGTYELFTRKTMNVLNHRKKFCLIIMDEKKKERGLPEPQMVMDEFLSSIFKRKLDVPSSS